MSRLGLLGAGASCAALLTFCASALATATSHKIVASSGGVVATLTYVHRPKSESSPTATCGSRSRATVARW